MIRWDSRNSRWRWEFDRIFDGTRIRKSRLLARGLTEEQASAVGAKLEADEFIKRRMVRPRDGWSEYVGELIADRKSWLHTTLSACKARSTVRGRESGLTVQHLEMLLRRSGGRCEVTGIPFQLHKPEGARARPFFHSLDRIDASQGYVQGNCRIVCYAVNLAMSNWGEDVFAQVATGYIVNRYCALGLAQHALKSACDDGASDRTTPDFLPSISGPDVA